MTQTDTHGTDDETQAKMTNRALALVESMNKRDFKQATTHFDSTMIDLFPAAKAEELWTQIASKVGAFEKVEGTKFVKEQHPTVMVAAKFEKEIVYFLVTFNESANVTGLHLTDEAAVGKPGGASA